MPLDDSTPPPPRGEEALRVLEPAIEDREDGLDRSIAVELLTEEGFDDESATTVIDQLLNRGYLYDVDGHLRVTN